ncbi:MAG: rhamnulokinase [Clostridia bacterium]|nr:rhamnulokinase [Clostridia bacterium]
MGEVLKMLAFDFGASSGRSILGVYDGRQLTIEEMHRFSNDPVEINHCLHWDVLRLFFEIKQGILKCLQAGHRDISSIAVDTWGVDFGLLDEQGNLLGNPYHYRDQRTQGMMEKVFKLIPKEALYEKTGIEFMWFNTILQIYSMKFHQSPLLKEAKTLLLMPDLFHYFLTGRKTSEYSIASTTQLMEAEKGTWSDEIIAKLGLPREIFTDIVPSGTVIGELSEGIVKELGASWIKVVAVAGHDTQCAIASVPAKEEDFVFISCGTWSLMGVETDQPVINEKSSTLGFTNEGGVGNKITLLKNIMGLWLVQECKRQWEKEGEKVSFAELENMAHEAEPFASFIDPDDHSFISPGNMPERIREYCSKTNQKVPASRGEIVRCIAQSLALKYRMTVENLEQLLGKKLPVVHMVGGGIKDRMLCQFTANATARNVVAGPVEATSIGNLMVQAMALGKVKDLKEIRSTVAASFPTENFKPTDTASWNDAYNRFKNIIG